jgi:hypothetical protein
MSIDAMTAVFGSALPHRLRLIALTIAWHAHKDGSNAYPSVQTIARLCGCHVRGISRGLSDLRRLGVVRVDSRLVTSPKDGSLVPAGGRHQSARYRLDYEALAHLKPCSSVHGFARQRMQKQVRKPCKNRYENHAKTGTETMQPAAWDPYGTVQEPSGNRAVERFALDLNVTGAVADSSAKPLHPESQFIPTVNTDAVASARSHEKKTEDEKGENEKTTTTTTTDDGLDALASRALHRAVLERDDSVENITRQLRTLCAAQPVDDAVREAEAIERVLKARDDERRRFWDLKRGIRPKAL